MYTTILKTFKKTHIANTGLVTISSSGKIQVTILVYKYCDRKVQVIRFHFSQKSQ